MSWFENPGYYESKGINSVKRGFTEKVMTVHINTVSLNLSQGVILMAKKKSVKVIQVV